MTNPQAQFLAKLNAIRQKFIDSMPGRLEQITDGWQKMKDHSEEVGKQPSDKTRDERILNELIKVVHTLAGSGQTYGYSALGRHAKVFENSLKAVRDRDGVITGPEIEKLTPVFEKLIEAAAASDSEPFQELLG